MDATMSSMQGLALYKLSGQLSTRQSCQDAVDTAAADPSIKTAIFLINMQQTSQRQVSMLRNMVDESSKAHVHPSAPPRDHMDCDSVSFDDKTFILLLHHLPGELVTNQYPAHFLYGWSFWYLDSFTSQQRAAEDVAADGPPVDLWLEAAASGISMPSVAKQALAGEIGCALAGDSCSATVACGAHRCWPWVLCKPQSSLCTMSYALVCAGFPTAPTTSCACQENAVLD